MEIRVSHARIESNFRDYDIGFHVTTNTGKVFFTSAMVSGEEAEGKSRDDIISIAWTKVKKHAEDHAAFLEQNDSGREIPDFSDVIGSEFIPPAPVAKKISIFGPNLLEGEKDIEKQYIAQVLDQYGRTIEGEVE
jgi:hypothetical protein